MAKIQDIYGKDYRVQDLGLFKKHIKNFHTINGIPDNSIHEEHGYYFKIDQSFYDYLKKLK